MVVPDAKRNLFSVRQALLAGHRIEFGQNPGLYILGNRNYFVPFTTCPNSGLWLIKLLPPPTKHNRIYASNNVTEDALSQALTQPATDTRLEDHAKLGHISFKRMRELDIQGITKTPPAKRLKKIKWVQSA